MPNSTTVITSRATALCQTESVISHCGVNCNGVSSVRCMNPSPFITSPTARSLSNCSCFVKERRSVSSFTPHVCTNRKTTLRNITVIKVNQRFFINGWWHNGVFMRKSLTFCSINIAKNVRFSSMVNHFQSIQRLSSYYTVTCLCGWCIFRIHIVI